MSLPDDDRAELLYALNRFTDRADSMLRNSTHQNVTLSGGSLGVQVASFCAGISFVMFLVMLALYVGHDRKIERMQDHLNAIYMMAPHLKPDEKKE